MKKTKFIVVLFSMSFIMFGCSDNKIKESKSSATSTSETKKEVVKKKTKKSSETSSSKESETTITEEKIVETQAVEVVQENPAQPTSDMPSSWKGSVEDWEIAKTQGWTAADYEQQVKASENESGPIQPGDPDYVWPHADEQRDQFFNEFYSEHGREPTSGEIQTAWAKEHGLE